MSISLRVLVLLAALAVSGAAVASPAAAGSDLSRQSAVLHPTLSSLRLIGGSHGEQGARVAVGGSGNVFLAGTTSSTNLPLTKVTAPPVMPKFFLGRIVGVS